MSELHPDMLVKCIRRIDSAGFEQYAFPSVGTIYRVREVGPCGLTGQACILLHEITNPTGWYRTIAGTRIHGEPGFCASYFRPVDAQRLDVFRSLLVTPPKVDA